MPDELALHFDDHDVVVVQLTDHARCPVVAELRELLGQVDRAIHAAQLLHSLGRYASGTGAVQPGLDVCPLDIDDSASALMPTILLLSAKCSTEACPIFRADQICVVA